MYPARWAAEHPEKPAVIVADDGAIITYAELDLRSRRLAAGLRGRGIGHGDHIAMMLPNTPAYFEIVWAALLVGAVVTPISSQATADDAAYILADSGADMFLTTNDYAATVADLPSRVPSCNHWLWIGSDDDRYESYADVLAAATEDSVDPDAPMGDYMLYSSGTTGRPKGVHRAPTRRTISQGSIANRFLSKVFGVDADSVFLSPAPLYHGAPLGFSVGVTSLGGTVVIMRRFDAELAVQALSHQRVTHSQWVPTMFVRMLALPDEVRGAGDLSGHRVAIHSAAPCPRHVKEEMMRWWGPILHEYYSGTEDIGVTYAGPQDWLAHPGTVGRPLGFAIHICDEGGHEVPSGESGLVYFETRSDGFEYHGDQAKTRKARHPEHPSWVTLDDIGHVDADGFLYLTDRASFMIISGGVNIYPREVEDVLLQHPAVADVAVIGIPDDEFGEQVKAIVEPIADAEACPELAADLLQFARNNLAGPKRPKSIDFVVELPRLATGKLAKHALRQKYSKSHQ